MSRRDEGMDLHQSVCHLLKEEIGFSQITRSAYDTAWVARLDELGEPVGEQALEWLRSHQLADGSWGASEPRYFHDRVICTLAAMTALARRGEVQDHTRLRRAQLALETAILGLRADPAGETVGFEMLVPTLLAEAEALDAIQRHDDVLWGKLARQRAAKLAALSGRKINRFVTLAHSTEMVGPGGLHLLDIENLQEANGSVASSPAATAFFAIYVRHQDPSALRYLREVGVNGAVPTVQPFENFERSWTLWNLALTSPLDNEILALCQPPLNFLEAEWKSRGDIAPCICFAPRDSDDTSLTYDVLTRFGRSVDLEAVLSYEEDDHFRCFALEANPSICANIHVLGALRQAGFGVQHPSVQKVVRFLRRTQTLQMFWFDKWHASPYYPTAHAIIACAGFDDDLVRDAVRWILSMQNADGSWGYYMSTAEETAYCLQAVIAWKRHGRQVPGNVLRHGAVWLAEHTELPYPPLWIGKCLYCPQMVVRSAILSALILVAQEK